MNKKTLSTRAIAYVALFIAMQLVLEVLFKVIPGQPQGGSITLSLLPIVLASYLMGAQYGIIVGVGATAMQFVLGLALYYGPWSVVLDYLVPLSALGIAGFIPNFKSGKTEVYTGIFVGMILKFISHLLSGAVLFASYAPKNMNPWVYSFLYNIGYNVGTLILTYVVFALIYPKLQKAFKAIQQWETTVFLY